MLKRFTLIPEHNNKTLMISTFSFSTATCNNDLLKIKTNLIRKKLGKKTVFKRKKRLKLYSKLLI